MTVQPAAEVEPGDPLPGDLEGRGGGPPVRPAEREKIRDPDPANRIGLREPLGELGPELDVAADRHRAGPVRDRSRAARHAHELG